VYSIFHFYHIGKQPISARILLSKLFATVCTLGTDGLAGRAGPATQICVDFGSILGMLLYLLFWL
jgi:H+/Cl- antiporter ClcA